MVIMLLDLHVIADSKSMCRLKSMQLCSRFKFTDATFVDVKDHYLQCNAGLHGLANDRAKYLNYA